MELNARPDDSMSKYNAAGSRASIRRCKEKRNCIRRRRRTSTVEIIQESLDDPRSWMWLLLKSCIAQYKQITTWESRLTSHVEGATCFATGECQTLSIEYQINIIKSASLNWISDTYIHIDLEGLGWRHTLLLSSWHRIGDSNSFKRDALVIN